MSLSLQLELGGNTVTEQRGLLRVSRYVVHHHANSFLPHRGSDAITSLRRGTRFRLVHQRLNHEP